MPNGESVAKHKEDKPREVEPNGQTADVGDIAVCPTCKGSHHISVSKPTQMLFDQGGTTIAKLWQRAELRAAQLADKPYGSVGEDHEVPCPKCSAPRCLYCDCVGIERGAIVVGERNVVRRLNIKVPLLAFCKCTCHSEPSAA
jgi:hypothetical protein